MVCGKIFAKTISSARFSGVNGKLADFLHFYTVPMSVVGCLLCWLGVSVVASCLMLVVEYCLSSAAYRVSLSVGVVEP